MEKISWRCPGRHQKISGQELHWSPKFRWWHKRYQIHLQRGNQRCYSFLGFAYQLPARQDCQNQSIPQAHTYGSIPTLPVSQSDMPKLHLFDLLWICRGFVVQHFDFLWICHGFVVDLLYNCSICCGLVVDFMGQGVTWPKIKSKMADFDDEDELLVTFAMTSVAAAAATFMLDAAATTRKRRHRVWVNKYLQRRAQYGTYNSLMIDLLELDDGDPLS